MTSRFDPPAVYPIADHDALRRIGATDPVEDAGGELARAVDALASGGASWVQVRAKRLSDAQLYDAVERCCAAVANRPEADTAIWVNDRVDLAALLPVAGVHLGQDDLTPEAARKVVGVDRWIGRSTHNEAQFVEAIEDPDVDVVALGPIFPTTSKTDAEPVVGLELLSRLSALTAKPVVAIGGIGAENLSAVRQAGADTVAVLGAVCTATPRGSFERLSRQAVERRHTVG